MSENSSRHRREDREQGQGRQVLDSIKQTFQRDPSATCLGNARLTRQHKWGINTATCGRGAGLNIKDNTFLSAASAVNWCNNYCMCKASPYPRSVLTAPASAEQTFVPKSNLWKCKTAADAVYGICLCSTAGSFLRHWCLYVDSEYIQAGYFVFEYTHQSPHFCTLSTIICFSLETVARFLCYCLHGFTTGLQCHYEFDVLNQRWVLHSKSTDLMLCRLSDVLSWGHSRSTFHDMQFLPTLCCHLVDLKSKHSFPSQSSLYWAGVLAFIPALTPKMVKRSENAIWIAFS